LAFQRSVCFIRLREKSDPKFFYYFTQSRFFQEQLASRAKSAAQGGIYLVDVAASSVLYPPLEEQTGIAKFLDAETAEIDSLISELQLLTELLSEKRQAAAWASLTKNHGEQAPETLLSRLRAQIDQRGTLVVSDRTVIDSQLQEALFDFQRQTGVVATITSKDGSKSSALAAALSGDKKIVVCTIQTFPFAIEAVRELAATQRKRFAVIADEAHSSQTGEAASKLRAVLSQEELSELNDGGEVTTEDILAAEMAARAGDKGITYVAFTATPKNKTMELFGTRPDPTKPAGPGNLPAPFHLYSMRQAIEEKFIHFGRAGHDSKKMIYIRKHVARIDGDKKAA
jgi:hypothetical protein